MSADAIDLIKRLIVLDPDARLSYHEALEHPWIRGNAPDTQLPGEYILEIGTFNTRRGMYRLATHALAGLVNRFAQPDVIGAISADTNSLSRVLQVRVLIDPEPTPPSASARTGRVSITMGQGGADESGVF